MNGVRLPVALKTCLPIERALWYAVYGAPLEWFDARMVLKPEHVDAFVAWNVQLRITLGIE